MNIQFKIVMLNSPNPFTTSGYYKKKIRQGWRFFLLMTLLLSLCLSYSTSCLQLIKMKLMNLSKITRGSSKESPWIQEEVHRRASKEVKTRVSCQNKCHILRHFSSFTWRMWFSMPCYELCSFSISLSQRTIKSVWLLASS